MNYIRFDAPMEIPNPNSKNFDKGVIYYRLKSRLKNRERVRAPFPVDISDFTFHCWPDPKLAEAARALYSFTAAPVYAQNSVWVEPHESIFDATVRYSPERQLGLGVTSLRSTLNRLKDANAEDKFVTLAFQRRQMVPVGQWDYHQSVANRKRGTSTYKVPLALMPAEMGATLHRWLLAKTAMYWQRRAILALYRYLSRRCNTPGQLIRVWPAMEGVITGRAAERAAARRVKSPWPCSLDKFDPELPAKWMSEIIAEAYLFEDVAEWNADLEFLGSPHEYN